MLNPFRAFTDGAYAPHGYCLLWQPELIWTHVLADAIIGIAYFSIPLVLMLLIRRRHDLAFGWVFWMFAAFIMACGLTHFMSIWTLWQPVYGLEAFIKVITAIASLATAILIWPLLPKAIALPSSESLRAKNEELAETIRQRDAALEEARDQIQQRERAEAALLQAQKLEALGQLTGGIAHDFNNLLQAVAGNLELIARKPDDADRVVRWSSSALDAVERGRSLTSQLLAFSRKQRLTLQPVSLLELVADSRDLIERAVAPLSSVEVARIDPALVVQADPLQLELAILNIAFNARDAMPTGGVLHISARALDEDEIGDLLPGRYIALTLTDEGEGMTSDVRNRALEPFFTTKEVGKGTGMGLSMVFGVLTQSGGTVKIESEPGKGSTIMLILRAADARPPRQVDGDPDHVRIDLSGRKIALVDDDAQVRSALADTLRAAGAELFEAGSGLEGIEVVRAARPDLLIADFAMPRMNGAEMIGQVAEGQPALPVILITGYSDSEKIEALDGLRVSILRKPFESDELLQLAAKLIEAR